MRFPIVMIILSYLILIATDLLIIRDLRSFSIYSRFKPSKAKKRCRWWKFYLVFAILILILLTVAICFPVRDYNTDLTPVMWMLYIVSTVAFAQLIYSFFSLLGLIPLIFNRREWNTGLWVGFPLGILVFSSMWWGALIGRNKIETNYITIQSDKLPESFNGYRIAQVSDLHVGTWGTDTTFVSKLVTRVNELKPDLIVFTGDLVNRKSNELLPFLNPLSKLEAPDGVMSILGNHDYGDYISWNEPESKLANLDSLKKYQERMGWKVLDNTHTFISKSGSDSIVVIGVGNWGEPPFSQYGDIKKAYPEASLRDKQFKILLSHNPEHWNQEVSKISNIDLTLSGHTHAMQIMFSVLNWKWSPAKFKYDQWAGLYSRKNKDNEETKLYVNIGAGEVGMPMRIGATPEITLITLER